MALPQYHPHMWLEGQFVKTHNNLIFEVKGIVHPPERTIAYLRYVPNTQAYDKDTKASYIKMTDFSERTSFLSRHYPEFLWYSPVHHTVLQSVRVHDVHYVYDPIHFLESIRSMPSDNSIYAVAVDLCERLIDVSGLRWRDLGVTGSLLLGLATSASDIDLVVYGSKAAYTLHESLASDRSSVGLERYDGSFLLRHVEFRWGSLPRHLKQRMLEVESAKEFQGVFSGKDVFIRAVKSMKETKCEYGDLVFTPGERVSMVCRIESNLDAILTPCEYKATSLCGPSISTVVSYRGRFCEQAAVGSLVYVAGALETVFDTRSGTEVCRVIVGNDPRDCMVPLTNP